MVSNSTFSGNTADDGCAIYNYTGLLSLQDVTVADNHCGAAFAALVASADGEGFGDIAVRNSVITTAGAANCRTTTSIFGTGSFISGGYNLSRDASCGFAAAGDIQSIDRLLGPLAANGGPTQTHLPR